MASRLPLPQLIARWLDRDKDPATRREIEDLVAASDNSELERRLRNRIAFGTAGLRARMGAGFSLMNSLTVLEASQGLASYILLERDPSHTEPPRVVVGYDARHNSEKFARLAAAAFLEFGLEVLWFGRLVHTPLVPFAVSHYGAVAGIMVTASHNPKNDNGYKVYWKNGCQIIPPQDKGIASAISEVDHIVSWDEALVDGHAMVQSIFDQAYAAYKNALQSLVKPPSQLSPALHFTYTPMHGVGLSFMRDAVHSLGFTGRCHILSPLNALYFATFEPASESDLSFRFHMPRH
jgi:phosphoglucomutase